MTEYLRDLHREIIQAKTALKDSIPEEHFKILNEKINEKVNSETSQLDRKHINKLNRLYDGHVVLCDSYNRFINLSQHELSQNEENVLNLGLNCHIQSKFDPLKRRWR